MTRVLSQLLGADEPGFSQSLQELEQAAGRPSTDIRLTSELQRRLRGKLIVLGLDPNDTNGPELYKALEERLKRDDSTLRQALSIAEDASTDDVMAGIQQFVESNDMPKTCFALKTSVAKRLLKHRPPKTAMKRLGYRSVDSMLKHEAPADLYAAAVLTETPAWHAAFRQQYLSLAPGDFEMRPIALHRPKTKRWQALSSSFVAASRHHILTFKELGSIVLLPLEKTIEALAITATLLILEEVNNIRAYSSFVKLQQVKPDFGQRLQQAVTSEPRTAANLAGQPVPWRVVQRYYSRFDTTYHADLFEPHVQPEDLRWQSGEEILADLAPSLGFWQGTQTLGLIHDGQPVSCNALDVALGCCNHLPFEDRIVHFVRGNLWHELMARYLHQGNLEAAVRQQLSGELVEPTDELLPEEIEAEAV